MAETTPAPNNKQVAFKGKPMREMKRVKKNASRAVKRGMISEKAAKKHLKGY
jgi:hypothetical protein